MGVGREGVRGVGRWALVVGGMEEGVEDHEGGNMKRAGLITRITLSA